MSFDVFGRAAGRAVAELQREVASLRAEVAKLSTELRTGGQAAIVAELAELNAALEKHIRTTRRELGEVHKRQALAEPRPEPAPETAEEARARLRALLPIPKIGKGP